MAGNGQKQSSQEVFSGTKNSKTHHNVWQDKSAFARDRMASRQTSSLGNVMRSRTMNKDNSRSQNNNKPRRKKVPLSLWIRPEAKAEISRLAKEEGLSFSMTGATLLEEALRQGMHTKQGALLQPIIEQAIRRQMRVIGTRLAWLLVRVAFDAGQTRSLVTNVLGRQPGVTPEVLEKILAGSGKTAKGNIMRRTPQLTELIEAVEQWMVEEDPEREPKG
jgi:hypothetical protein